MEEKIYIIDLNHLDSDEVYGVKNIAFTTNPAIKLTGLALSDIEKQLIFEDEKKMQICAPLLVPMKVYRYDNKDGDFYVQFTEEVIERVAKNMMKNLSMSGQESIFTNEHTDQKLNAYIFELMLVDNEKKQSFIKENYNYDMPLGGVWLTVQCDDAETYEYIVENKKMGFSIDGLFPLKKLQKQINMSKEEKKIELELEEGKKYVVKDGELVLEEAPKEEPKEEPEKEEPEKEVKEELEEEPEPKEEQASEVLTKATLSEALTPLIDAISELKAEIVNAKADAVEDTTVQMTDEEKPKYKFALQWILGR